MAHRSTPVVENEFPARVPSSNRQNSGDAAPLKGKSGVTDCVDAPVHLVQPSGERAPSNRIVAYAETPHLSNSDHSMLTVSHSGDQSIGWAYFPVHFTDK